MADTLNPSEGHGDADRDVARGTTHLPESAPPLGSPASIDRRLRLLRTSRSLAAAMVQAIALSPLSLEEIAASIGRDEGYIRHRLWRLLNGKAVPLDDVSDIMLAAGCELRLTVSGGHEPS